MMHELAHNKQMNHSKAFWAVRNEFAAEMKGLWEKKYTGDGLWGRGVLMENGAFALDTLEDGEVLPEHMCGGTFRSRGGKKRKVKPKITYKEAKKRRIKKKFGVNGMALGADEEVKTKLEKGKKPAGKPRVAGSARGRELRAAAALARFEVKEEEPQIKDEDLVTDSEAESVVEDNVYIKPEPDDAIDINGKRLTDNHGRGMVKVCEDEDKNDDDAKRELLELQSIPGQSQQYFSKNAVKSEPSPTSKPSASTFKFSKPLQTSKPEKSAQTPLPKAKKETMNTSGPSTTERAPKGGDSVYNKPPPPSSGSCPVCSVDNEPNALTCMVCANVLKPELVANSWRCKSSTCKDGEHVNAGDVGVCGVCGARK